MRAYAALAERRPKHLVLILAREFASNLATPTMIVNEAGRLVFFNDAAEALFGRPFAGVGEVPVDEFTASLRPRHGTRSRCRPSAGRPGSHSTSAARSTRRS